METSQGRQSGIVHQYDHTRGLGVIKLPNGETAQVRYSAILGEGVRSLQAGDEVEFELEPNSHGFSAVRVLRR